MSPVTPKCRRLSHYQSTRATSRRWRKSPTAVVSNTLRYLSSITALDEYRIATPAPEPPLVRHVLLVNDGPSYSTLNWDSGSIHVVLKSASVNAGSGVFRNHDRTRQLGSRVARVYIMLTRAALETVLLGRNPRCQRGIRQSSVGSTAGRFASSVTFAPKFTWLSDR